MTDPAEQHRDLDALVGRILVDRYRIDALLGLGAMGAVFRGHQLTLKRDVAIKILHPELVQDEQIAKRFEREAESAARLEHPNIVQVLEQGVTADGYKFIVMQLLEGGELADRLDHPLSVAQATIWALEIFAALEHAHAHGIIHRDLKPENIFVSSDHDGREILKLVDFGIAKIVGGPDTGEPMTKLGLVFGTPAYMSPEQATGLEIDERTDLYSAGIILYQMLAGHLPFRNADPVALIRMQVGVDPPPLPDEVPAALRAIVDRLLAKARDERFSNAAECQEALSAVLVTLDLDGLAIPSHIVRDVSGIVASASIPLGRAAAKAPRQRRIGRWLLVALAPAGLAVAAWIMLPTWLARLPSQETAAYEDPEPDGPAATESAGRAPAEELAAIDRLLLAKSPDPALELIRPLRDSYPRDPQLAWREGRALALEKRTRAAALVRYGEALDADAALIDDPGFSGELHALLEDKRLRAQALDFALQRLDREGHEFLLGLVNETNPERALRYSDRRRVLAKLSSDPESAARIDRRLNLARDLWQADQVADPCGVYHDALMAIAVAPDSMYLATLRSHGMPKKPAEELESAVCDELPLLRDRVLAAFEEAYAPDDPTAETAAPDDPELAPAEGSASPKTSSSKKAPSKKSSSKKSSSKQSASKKSSSKKDPFEKVGKKLEKLFEG